jgi:subtilisin-like proprotein convertase family protein
VPTPIADLTTITSTLFFTGLSTISDVNLTLDVTHTFASDLNAYLISPSGTRVELFNHVGGGENDLQNTTLDDEADLPITAGLAPFTGSFRPDGLLGDFDGEDPNGIWTLEITDDSVGDSGVLNGWSIQILGTELSTTTDADGNYSFTDLIPGMYVVRQVVQPGFTQTFATPVPIILELNEEYLGANFGNTAQVGLRGDYNSDDVVDIVDYIVWRKTMNQTVPPFSGADGNGDGLVNQADYDIWRANFGMTLASGGGGSAIAANHAEAGGVATPATGLPIVSSPDALEVEAGQGGTPIGGFEHGASQFSFRSVEVSPVSRSLSASVLRQGVADASQLNDAALLAALAAHSTEGAGEQQTSGASTAFHAVLDDGAGSLDSLDLAFEMLDGLAAQT